MEINQLTPWEVIAALAVPALLTGLFIVSLYKAHKRKDND